MIFVTDKGRLCNNILQYGHLYAWGREHGRKTMSMRFAYKYKDFHICHTRHHNFLVYVVAKYAAKLGLIPIVDFNDFKSDYKKHLHILQTRRWVLATGWCIRFYDLFDKYKDEILQLFAFDEKIIKKTEQQFSHDADDVIRLGVHIRRGDYATWCGGHYFYDDNQYARIIQQFCALFPDKQIEIFICGNDPKLDKNLYQQQFGASHVHFPNGSPTEDLCLLSHCHYLIGAPSTFTLIASMYQNNHLYWIVDAKAPLQLSSFSDFDHLSRVFDSLYIS